MSCNRYIVFATHEFSGPAPPRWGHATPIPAIRPAPPRRVLRFAPPLRAFAHSMAIPSDLLVFAHEGSQVLHAVRFLVLARPLERSLVWRLRFAKPALFLLFLFVAPIVLLSIYGHTSMAVELRLQRERCERGRARSEALFSAVLQCKCGRCSNLSLKHSGLHSWQA